MKIHELPSGRVVYHSPDFLYHLNNHRYFMSIEKGYEVSACEAFKDFIASDDAFNSASHGGMVIPDKVVDCLGCGKLYLPDWREIFPGEDHKSLYDENADIPVNRSWYDEDGRFRHYGSIEVSGTICPACLEEKSKIRAEENPEFWLYGSIFTDRFFGKHIEKVPEELRARLLPVLV